MCLKCTHASLDLVSSGEARKARKAREACEARLDVRPSSNNFIMILIFSGSRPTDAMQISRMPMYSGCPDAYMMPLRWLMLFVLIKCAKSCSLD